MSTCGTDGHLNSKGANIQYPEGEGWSFFEINNLGQTLHKINNLLQELF